MCIVHFTLKIFHPPLLIYFFPNAQNVIFKILLLIVLQDCNSIHKYKLFTESIIDLR